MRVRIQVRFDLVRVQVRFDFNRHGATLSGTVRDILLMFIIAEGGFYLHAVLLSFLKLDSCVEIAYIPWFRRLAIQYLEGGGWSVNL